MQSAESRLLADAHNRVMAQYGYAVGRHRSDLVTPALVLDVDVAQANIETMASAILQLPAGIRPHIKVHKSPELARRQVASGAHGVCTATVWEALVMVEAGIKDVFVVNTLAGVGKADMVAALARRATMRVAVDAEEHVSLMNEAAERAGTFVGLLIEVDTGMGRCGIKTADEALHLAEAISRGSHVHFDGVTGYEGHCSLTPDRGKRHEKQRQAMDHLVSVADSLDAAGVESPIVSAGGTATWDWTAAHPRITEIQAGSYVVMDAFHSAMIGGFKNALTVQSTVISVRADRVITDAGSKSIGDGEISQVVGHTCRPLRFDEEHGIYTAPSDGSVHVGASVAVIPGYAPSTVNWFDAYHVVHDDVVTDIWPIVPRGPGHGELHALGKEVLYPER